MKLIDFLNKHSKEMLFVFCLSHFEVTFKRRKNLDCLAEIDTDLEYLSATIFYGNRLEKLYRSGAYEEVLKTLAHEITHILLENLSETPGSNSKSHKVACEQATEHVSRLLYRLYIVEKGQ